MAEPLLDIRGLKTWFKTDDGMVRAVDGVDLHIDRGETLGVVGESGCGKTVTARSVLKLIDMPPGRFEAGQIRFDPVLHRQMQPAQLQHRSGQMWLTPDRGVQRLHFLRERAGGREPAVELLTADRLQRRHDRAFFRCEERSP